MVKTGRLEIDHNTGISQLNSGPGDTKRLAKTGGGGNPFGNATKFLVSDRGLKDGNFIFVIGENGTHSGVAVIFITDAGLAQEAVAVISESVAATKSGATTKKSGAKPAKKAAKPTKKASGKGGKKSSKKSGKKAKKK